MRVESRVTSLSWLPSEGVTGLMRATFAMHVTEYDDPPPDVIEDAAVVDDAYGVRFANRLRAWADFDGDRPVRYEASGGVVMGRTRMRLGVRNASFAAIAMPDLRPVPDVGPGWVRFSQTCGGRTASPLPRTTSRPPYVQLRSPLVWTTLTLTLYADGRATHTLTGASRFPRHWVYGEDDRLTLKAGLTDWREWTSQPSWRQTPWGEEDSEVVVTAAETELERRLSTVIMRGGRKPDVRRLPADSVLIRQGEPGGSLFVLLDGVVAITVDGELLAELGPGAVLGERAVLESGVRTSTVTAVTPIRVAEAPGDAIERSLLRELGTGHQRETQNQ